MILKLKHIIIKINIQYLAFKIQFYNFFISLFLVSIIEFILLGDNAR